MQANPTWGLDSIDGDRDKRYHYALTGSGVRVYVLDSGIKFNHKEFRRAGNPNESRAWCGINLREDLGDDCDDDYGHGTHVSAIIGMCFAQ